MADERPAIVVARGYMGNPEHWCFWDEEFPNDGSYGPYETEEEALMGVMRFCSWEDVQPPVRVIEEVDHPRAVGGKIDVPLADLLGRT